MCKLSATYSLLEPLTKQNGGHGPALIYGYRYAIEHGADWVFQTDSDRQTLPEEFEEFWNYRTNYDAVIGVRPERQDGDSRKLVEYVLCFLLRLVFGVRLRDANAPFRLMRASKLGEYLTKLPEDFNLPNAMLTTYFVYFDDRVEFRNVTFRPRQGGTNSINIKKIFHIGWKAIGDFRQLRSELDA